MAEDTVLNCILIAPVAEVCLNVIVPAVPVFTAYKPRSRSLPLKIGAAIVAAEPTVMAPAVAADTAIWLIVAK